VTQLAAVQQLVQVTVEAFGGLDILVINAGMNGDGRPVEDSHPEAWRTTLEVNLLGAYYCAQAAIPALKQRGAGKIITVGSGRGHRGAAGMSAYACSKAGLWMLTRVLAQELSPYNISVNALIPDPWSPRWWGSRQRSAKARLPLRANGPRLRTRWSHSRCFWLPSPP
jgi:3-oxoacyl-[acyl-carrier protein] reductase